MEEQETEKTPVENMQEMCPSLTLDSENKVILETIEVPLIVNKEEVLIKMQQVPAGKRSDMSKKYLQTRIQGQQISGNVDAMGFQLGMLSEAIIESPFNSDITTLKSMPDVITDYLYKKYSEGFKQDEKKNK